jgi:hypothetical protein
MATSCGCAARGRGCESTNDIVRVCNIRRVRSSLLPTSSAPVGKQPVPPSVCDVASSKASYLAEARDAWRCDDIAR